MEENILYHTIGLFYNNMIYSFQNSLKEESFMKIFDYTLNIVKNTLLSIYAVIKLYKEL